MARKKQVTTGTEIITPAIAERMLKLNTHNRPLVKHHVETLSGAMKRGEWQMNGDSIRFSTDNELLDGQHRLSAIVASGTEQEMVVVRNLPPESFHVIDVGGRARTAADILTLTGESNAVTLSSAARVIGSWECDPDLTKRTNSWTVPQVEALIDRHPGLRLHTELKPALTKLLPASLACALWYLFSLVDKAAANHFMDRLASGVGLEKGNPTLLLRDLLITNKSARSKYNKKIIAALTIKAFNYHRIGKHPHGLRWRVEESFPVITDMPEYVRESA